MFAVARAPLVPLALHMVLWIVGPASAGLADKVAKLLPTCDNFYNVNCATQSDGTKELKCISCGLGKFILEEKKCDDDVYSKFKKPVQAKTFLDEIKEALPAERKEKVVARAKDICLEPAGGLEVGALATYFMHDFTCTKAPAKAKDVGRVPKFKQCNNIYLNCRDEKLLCVTCDLDSGDPEKNCKYTDLDAWKKPIAAADYIGAMRAISPLSNDDEFKEKADSFCKGNRGNVVRKAQFAAHAKLFMLDECAGA